MPNIQIKDVPEETHEVLTKRAADSHQSLQAYLRQQLIEQAGRPTLAEFFDRIERTQSGGRLTFEEAAELIRQERESH